MNIRQLMKQAQQMQEQLQRELTEVVVEASVGGGMLTLRMNGRKELLAVTIDPEVMDPDDPNMLQDLIVAAVNDAGRQVDEKIQERVGGTLGGLPGLS
jgi:DNA-binding YbaB/EbfC family protein